MNDLGLQTRPIEPGDRVLYLGEREYLVLLKRGTRCLCIEPDRVVNAFAFGHWNANLAVFEQGSLQRIQGDDNA